MQLLDTTATVDTPERVRFRYRLAGPGRRAVAYGVDMVVRGLILTAVGLVVALVAAVPGLDGIGMGALFLVLFLLDWGYGVLFETLLHGRTPGKLALKVRVVRVDGAPARFPDFALRNLLRAVDFLPVGFLVGVVVMLGDDRLRRLGDLVAGTVVVHEGRSRVLGEVAVEPPVTEAERLELPPRVDLSREELTVLEEFLRRRGRLSAERAEELAWLYGPALSERTGVTAPTWERVLTLAYARATGKDR